MAKVSACFHSLSLTEGSTGSSVKQTPWGAGRHEAPGKRAAHNYNPAPHFHTKQVQAQSWLLQVVY